jgi:hypothetical protein
MTSYTARALSTDRLQHFIHQVAHGFVIGKVLKFNGMLYGEAQADDANDSETVGMVSFIVGPDDFVLTQAGYVKDIVNASSPLIAGLMHYLDPVNPGEVTTTRPTTIGEVIVPLLIADTTSSGWYFNNAGTVIKSTGVTSWQVVAINTAMVPSDGYITSSGGTLTMTLPAAFAVGDIIRITNLLGQFTIAQNGGQSINFGQDTTTVGGGGSLTTTHIGDTLELVGITANTKMQVLSSIGNFTIV